MGCIEWCNTNRFSPYPQAPTCIASAIIKTPTRVDHLLQLLNLHWHVIITPSPQFTLEFTLGALHSMSWGNQCMTYMDHCSIIEYFLCPKNPWCSCLPHDNCWYFIVSLVLPLPECHIVGIIQSVAFSDQLLSLSNIHLRSPYGFLKVNSSFLFYVV